MSDRFVWKVQIEFEGTADEFNKLAGALGEMRVAVKVPEWGKIIDPHLAGCQRIPTSVLVGRDVLAKLIANMPRAELKFPMPDICGGIRTPHLHLENEVVLLDQERFRTMVGQVAKGLAERRVDKLGDYIEVMDAVGRLGSMPTIGP